MNNKYSFSYRAKTSSNYIILFVLACLFVISSTIAFFYSTDYANQLISMSGKVDIEAVGKGELYESIEDTYTSNLKVTLSDGYKVLIPGMDITVDANCKVYRSTTRPLLRAKLDFILSDGITGSEIDETDFLVSYIYSELHDIITANKWYLHTDSYFYYLGDVIQNGATYGNQIMQEVDATEGDVVVPFLDQSFKFPTSVTSAYSGYGVEFKITFQAIQNFIANKDTGIRLPNTITNSLIIFDDFYISYNETTDIQYFTVTVNSSGQYTIAPKSGVTLPETIVLPTTDAEGNTITNVSSSFGNIQGVKKVVIPSSYTTMDEGAFQYSTVQNVDMSQSGITEIPANSFRNSSLETIKLPEGLVSIGAQSFERSQLSSIVLPDTIVSIGRASFWNTNLQSIYIPESVETIGNQAIGYSTSLVQIVVDENNENYKDIDDKMLVSSDGTLLVYHGYVKSSEEILYIPEGVTRLASYSLSYVQTPTIYLPKSLTVIENAVFSGFLRNVIVDEGNTSFSSDDYALYNATKTELILCTDKSIDTYTMPETVASAKGNCFVNCVINSVYVNDKISLDTISSVNNWLIGLYAKNIVVDDNNPYIKGHDDKAVYTKDGKTLCYYAKNNTAISYTALSSVTKILSSAISRCNNLTEVVLPEGMLTLETSIFDNSINLKNVNIPSTVERVGELCFQNTAVETITIYGDCVKRAFISCTKLREVVFKESVTSIGNDAFKGCTALETVEFKSSTPPTFESGNIFTGASTDFKIYVPDSAVNAYKTANNFTGYADKIYPVSSKS